MKPVERTYSGLYITVLKAVYREDIYVQKGTESEKQMSE